MPSTDDVIDLGSDSDVIRDTAIDNSVLVSDTDTRVTINPTDTSVARGDNFVRMLDLSRQ